MIQEYGGNAREVIARQLAQVRLQCIAVPPPKPVGKELTTAEKHKQKLEEAENPTKPTITLKDGAMTISVQLGLGAAGVPSYSYVSETLNALFGVSASYFKQVLEDRIAKTKEEIKREVDDPNFDIEIVFDWQSFQNAGNMDSALNNMARWDCWYSLQTLPRAFRWAKSDYPVTHERLKKSLKRVVFSNAEDDGVEKRYWHSYAMLTNGTLEMRGVYREYWGYIYSYDVTRAVAYGCILDEADQAFENNETLDNEKLDILVRAVREICSSSAVRYGNLKPLIELSKRKCFPQLDEIDQEAVEICLKTYYKEVMCEEKQEYNEDAPFPETVIKAYSINKTNFRGQVQTRLAVITNKALYTFAFDYKKKELIKRRAHRYVYNNIYSTRYGPLREDNIQVVGGAAGAIANAAQDLMKDLSNYGLKIYTNIITSMKERMTEKAISKAAIGTEKEPVVDIPGLPKFNSPGFLLRTAATSLYKDKVDTQVSVNGLPQANVAHSLEVASEMFDTLSETVELDLPNLPNMKLTNLLLQICEILEQYNDDMDLEIPSSITISSLIRSINHAVYNLEQSGKTPTRI
ncbi:hypothetical protein FDP41_010253 [Naegleria fowleri]|uniref:Uncharacterized protein n=1 Tax=Naegleria fowleri TaxID=5763 RepID=A0A6A5BBL4_NAEFO|nr:uncharacterized protein FDP41_010253 [Naegleria fowleri]KAF0971480.1 hypothetical protein FDP41_010253 [Naegleria fowleri]